MPITAAQPPDRRVQEFTALYVAYSGRVLGYALRRASQADAEEIVEDVFLTAWRRPSALPADDPLPWLLATARNHLRNLRRSEQRRSRLTAKLTDTASEAPTDIATAFADREQALQALDTLPDLLRETVLLSAWDGLDRRSIAKVLGCSATAVAVRLHRARRLLASALAEHQGASESTSHRSPANTLEDLA